MKLRVVSHTHWDREWFLPAQFTREWLPEFFDRLLSIVRSDPTYQFVLDGQTILIEDAIREGWHPDPHQFQRHVASGQLAIGPYYQQPDWNLASPESLIRNITIGLADARQFGEPMRCGWLMDNFGQISQCPQIHASFGLKTLFMWRGLTLPPEQVRTEYRWCSPDGSSVTAVYLLDSYRNAMRLLERSEMIEARLQAMTERIRPFSPTGLALLMNGYDQEMDPEALSPLIQEMHARGYDIRRTHPVAFSRELSDTLGNNPDPPLPVVTGEQYSGRYICVFPGVLSSRIYLKRENYRVETEIECYTEPLLVAALARGMPWPSEKLDAVWRRILRNHPHDSICGVSVDDVHTDMEERFDHIRDELNDLSEAALTTLFGPSTDTDRSVAVVYNPLPYRRCGVVSAPGDTGDETVVSVDVPGTGWAALPGETSGVPRTPVSVDAENRTISNGRITVRAEQDGTIQVQTNGSATPYTGLLSLEDGGDAGDTYTYAPPRTDTICTQPSSVRITVEDRTPLRATLVILITIDLPRALSSDRRSRSRRFRSVPITHEVRLDADSTVVHVTTTVRNCVQDHRLRVRFPLPPELNRLVAGTPMDAVERRLNQEHFDDKAIPPELEKLMLGAREPDPIKTNPMRDYVSCCDETGTRGLAVCAPGLFEYEYERGIAIPIVRAVGWLARSDVPTRTGDAGPLIAVPDAQCLRDMTATFGLYPFTNADEARRVPSIAAEVRAPLRVYPGYRVRPDTQRMQTDTPTLETRPPGSEALEPGLLEIESDQERPVLSALTSTDLPAGKNGGSAVLLRLYHPGMRKCSARVRWQHPLHAVGLRNLAGETLEEIPCNDDGSFAVELPPHAIRTYELRWTAPKTSTETDRLPTRSDRARRAPGWSEIMPQEPITRGAADHLRSVSIPPAVDPSLPTAEDNRIKTLEAALKRARRRLAHPAETSTLHRTLLEARISAIMVNRKLQQVREGRSRPGPYDPDTLRDLRRIGRDLNHARIRKRTEDYLLAIEKAAIEKAAIEKAATEKGDSE